MDPLSIIAEAQIVIGMAKLAIQVGQDAAPYIERAFGILAENKPLTDQERADMATQEVQWRKEIDDAISSDDPTA